MQNTKKENSCNARKTAILLLGGLLFLIVLIVFLLAYKYNLWDNSFKSKLYVAENYKDIPKGMRDIFKQNKIWNIFPKSSNKIYCLSDKTIDPNYLIRFQTEGDDFWKFAESISGKKSKDFSKGNKSIYKWINLGPKYYDYPNSKFPWNFEKIKDGKFFESLYIFILIDETNKTVYLCLWSQGKNHWSVEKLQLPNTKN